MDLIDRISSGWKAWVLLLLITMGAAAPGVFSLPALDRDESRFAQASKQMLETGDYIRIRYQDELRNKKPAGIHWLQAGSTAAFSSAEAKEIWSYRVPSWIGAGLATLAAFWCGLALMNRRAAFLGSALFGATLLLTSEAHISKTDAVLVFLTTLGIGALARLYMQQDQETALSATHREAVGEAGGQNRKALALMFWSAMGLGFLIKGPVSIMVAAYAGFGAWAWAKAGENKGGDWWRVLIWWPGPVLFFALWIPWFIWIQTATDGQFMQGAVGKDLSDKFTGASEGHAGWPLYHLSHLPLWFFPATLLLIPGAVWAWQALRGQSEAGRRKGETVLLIAGALGGLQAVIAWLVGAQTLVAFPVVLILAFWGLGLLPGWHARWAEAGKVPAEAVRAMRFLIAWAVLTALFFELMPTRLSHYILPAYPALALLCGWAGERLMAGTRMPVSRWASLALFAFGGGLLAVVSVPGMDEVLMQESAGDFRTVDADTVMAQWAPMLEYPLGFWWVGLAVFIATLGLAAMRRIGLAVAGAVLAATLFGWHVRAVFLPSQTWVQPTVVARAALAEVCGLPGEGEGEDCVPPAMIQAVGYAEPSYVLTTGTQNLHPPETVVALPEHPPAVYLINLEDPSGPEAVEELKRQATLAGMCIETSSPHYAVNYSNGDPVHFIALRIGWEMGVCD